MRFSLLLSAGALLPTIGIAVPVSDALSKRENLCNLGSPPALCTPDPTVSVEETAQRAYNFYRAFVVDGDPRTMFCKFLLTSTSVSTTANLPLTRLQLSSTPPTLSVAKRLP